MTVDMDDIKTIAAISEVGKEDDIDRVERKYQEEVASLQQILKGLRFIFHFVYSRLFLVL